MPAAEASVRGDGLHLTITATGYEFPAVTSGEDANWIGGLVALTVGTTGHFTAEHRVWLWAPDLERFRDELRVLDRELSGTATLRHLEAQIDLTITLENGVGTICGSVSEHTGAELNFDSIRTDQTYVRQALTEFHQIAQTYPSR